MELGVGHETVEVDGLLAREHAAEALGIEVPAGDRILQGVDLDGVGHGLAARVGVRVAGDDGAQRRQAEQQEPQDEQPQGGRDDAVDELRLVEPDRAERLVGVIVHE